MSSQPFSIFDIDNDLIHFADMYLKNSLLTLSDTIIMKKHK